MRTRLFLLLISVLFLLLSGCSSSMDKPDLVEGGECLIQGEEAPLWVCGGYQEESRYIAVGSAPMSRLGYDFSRKEALNNARAALANQISADIKSRLESYRRSTGADEITAERVVTDVSRQTSQITLNDTQQVSFWQHPQNQTLFILVGINKELVGQILDQQMKPSAE